MTLIGKRALIGASIVLVCGQISAVEVQPIGQVQAQTDFGEPDSGGESRWSLAMDQSFVGLAAVETLETSAIKAHWQVGINPLADSDVDVVLEPQQAFIAWNQGVFGLTVGRLESLEQSNLISLSNNLLSLSNKGMSVASYFEPYENKALRLDIGYGQFMTFSGQWVIDESTSDTPWSISSVVNTAEGSISATYRKAEDEDAFWGTQLTWYGSGNSVTAAWVYQDELLTWDASIRTYGQKTQSFLSFSSSNDSSDKRWAAGVQQPLSESVMNFSEVLWWPDTDKVDWSTGFRLSF